MTAMIEATLTKRYGGREVLSAARLEVAAGTVHALVGENGAGKSTLVKIIAGIVRADGGSLAIGGTNVDLGAWDRRRARAAGIGIVQQHGASAGTLSVVENAVLGAEGGALLDLAPTAKALEALGAKVGLPIDPWARADRLPLGAAQRAEIVAALHHGAKLLILDEPTAVLAPVEVDGLLATLRTLAKGGTTIVLVTHKLDEVRAVADTVTVLRAGKTVGTFGAPLEVATIARAMVGAELPPPSSVAEPAGDAPVVLALEHVGVAGALPSARPRGRFAGLREAFSGEKRQDAPAPRENVPLADISLVVRAGELVGVAGVDGNGQRELAQAIAGLVPHTGGVKLGGEDISRASAGERLAAGLAHIPEDRHHGGLVLEASIADNLALARRDITGRFAIDRARVRRFAEEQIRSLDIRPTDPEARAAALSGGNQQKIVIARELSRPHVRVVLASQPTRGVDLGAVVRIHDRLRAAAAAGAGVLVISADLDELLALCHRVVVMLRGKIVGERAGAALQGAEARSGLGDLMTGAA
ncbi:MAG: ATP-binding cassette domain-containing protein [Deltaproteobacteria bacterium]|nr:ATP-binding cassette domain-containing protein [Deltaproteobacteria bacterium]